MNPKVRVLSIASENRVHFKQENATEYFAMPAGLLRNERRTADRRKKKKKREREVWRATGFALGEVDEKEHGVSLDLRSVSCGIWARIALL